MKTETTSDQNFSKEGKPMQNNYLYRKKNKSKIAGCESHSQGSK